MSVLIRGVDLPSCCDKCFAFDDDGDYPLCLITSETRGYTFRARECRMDGCPLVEVAAPYGNLIDQSELLREFCGWTCGFPPGKCKDFGALDECRSARFILNAATVIPSEEE